MPSKQALDDNRANLVLDKHQTMSDTSPDRQTENSMSNMAAVTVSDLYDTLGRRLRPEDVAALVTRVDGKPFTPDERRVLETAARHSMSYTLASMTSMAQEFKQAVPPERQVRVTEALLKVRTPLTPLQCADAIEVQALVVKLTKKIKAASGATDFKFDRLNRKDRRRAGLGRMSKRRYNKLFRLLGRFEARLVKYVREQQLCEAGMVAKSGLVTKLSRQAFAASTEAACFIAYYTARRNRRSVFTNVGQESAFDKVAEMLLNRVDGGWFAVAHAFPEAQVVTHLNSKQKMALLVLSLETLKGLSQLLKSSWQQSKFDRAKMIVAKGDDSSTWNALAGAWNAARSSYLQLLLAMGAEDTLDELCIGKVMRLMAADVAWWHRSSGGDLDPNTAIWAALPEPWDVLDGTKTCTKADVIKACKVRGMDPYSTGWLPKSRTRVAVPFKPTPELVHGVAVSSPELASMLRKCGWFSGKSIKGAPEVEVDVIHEDGFAVLAIEA